MMSTETFWRTVVCGIIATFVMAVVSFLQGGIGLPVIDVGHILKYTFNQVHDDAPYSLLIGNVAYFGVGILMALFWVTFLQERVPGNWLVQGLIFGVMVSLAAGLIVAPLASAAGGQSFGIFYMDTWTPGLVALAGLIMHVVYGLVLTICLKYAGVRGLNQPDLN